MLIKRTLLVTAILATSYSQMAAAEESAGFIAGSKLDLNLRTFYFHRDRKPSGSDDSIALTQGLRLNFESGYFNNIIGFDASIFAVGALSAKDDEGGTSTLRTTSNGEQKGYAKFGQAYAKVKLGENSGLKIGRMTINTPLLDDSDSRVTPSSTQGVYAFTQYQNIDLYGIWTDRGSAKTSEQFNEYTDTNGDDYSVGIVGGGYKFNSGVKLDLAYGEADNVLSQTYVSASYPIALSAKDQLNLSSTFYHGEADGEGAQTNVGADYSSNLYSLSGQWVRDNKKLTLAYQKVNGDEYQESWDDFSNDDTGLYSSNSVQFLDFDRAEERSVQARVDYDVTAIKGLSLMARYIRGDNIKRSDGQEGKEWERDLEAKYAFQNVDGLSLRLRNATVRSTETTDVDENRLILDYNIPL
ncbi:MAG: OprD family outer membrane porin [Oceanospirillaceae bacterium]